MYTKPDTTQNTGMNNRSRSLWKEFNKHDGVKLLVYNQLRVINIIIKGGCVTLEITRF